MNISLDLYKVFYVVAKNRSMSKAAEILYISQPAISKSIKNLEEQLGVYLFTRSNKGLSLTNEGMALLEKIEPAMAIMGSIENELSDFKDLSKGNIRIGISSVLTKCVLVDVFSIFKEKYPNVSITLYNGLTSELLENLSKGNLDFVIYNKNDEEEVSGNIKSIKFLELRYVFFCNPMCYNMERSLESISKLPLILQSKASNTRKFLDKHTNGVLVPNTEVVSQDLICNMVNKGFGAGFAFEKMADMVNPNFKKVSLRCIPKAQIMLATNTLNKLNYASKVFVKMLKDFYN